MRRAILAIVSTVAALVLLLSFKTHTTASLATTTVSSTPAATGTASAGSTGSGAASTAKKTATTKKTSTTKTTTTPTSTATKRATTTQTVTGTAVNTQYGPVQVEITVKNGTLTAVTAVEYPNGNPRDSQINAYAIPALTQEALAAKSAQISMISGATFTSNGYIASLQSALDKVA